MYVIHYGISLWLILTDSACTHPGTASLRAFPHPQDPGIQGERTICLTPMRHQQDNKDAAGNFRRSCVGTGATRREAVTRIPFLI